MQQHFINMKWCHRWQYYILAVASIKQNILQWDVAFPLSLSSHFKPKFLALSGSTPFVSHGLVAAARLPQSSCPEFFPYFCCTVWIWPPVQDRADMLGCCGCCWLRLGSALPYWLIPLLSAGISAHIVASLTQVCQNCHRLVQAFS